MKEYKYSINGNEYTVAVIDLDGNTAAVEVNGTSYKVDILGEELNITPLSPLPGVILDLKVNVGDQVKAGQTVAVLEAMKMENNINAEHDGVVTAIKVNKGDSILEGAEILLIG